MEAGGSFKLSLIGLFTVDEAAMSFADIMEMYLLLRAPSDVWRRRGFRG